MSKSATRRDRRASRRTLAAVLRTRAAAGRLASSCHRRPRSLATVAVAAGVTKDTAAGVANGLRAVAKRLGLTPAATARTRRTVAGGRARTTRTVYRYSLAQVRLLLAAYKPRKAAFVTAVTLIGALAAA